ncbi:quinone-dependent dihydroorotate dehydrogenase [soil metagenome]
MLYRSLLRPLLFRLSPETAHELALHTLSFCPRLIKQLLAPRSTRRSLGELRRFGLSFPNPVGLAAGFDKDGIALESLAALGFGFIEAGTVTYEPQSGNQRPRLFRLPQDKALINRAGFNNKGAVALAQQVTTHRPDCILGVSIGKSKTTPIENAVKDYLRSFDAVFAVADYIAVNVSSPNTPRLRDLQRAEHLEELLLALQRRNQELSEHTSRGRLTPLLVKLAPDLGRAELELVVDVVKRTKVAGLIATNTTIHRDGLRASKEEIAACGEGGLSGAPLRRRSTNMIATLYNLTAGLIPIAGVGGVFTAEDAWEKICAGASLIQLYTGFIYQGPRIAQEINDGLDQIIRRERFGTLDEAVGSRAKELAP